MQLHKLALIVSLRRWESITSGLREEEYAKYLLQLAGRSDKYKLYGLHQDSLGRGSHKGPCNTKPARLDDNAVQIMVHLNLKFLVQAKTC